MSLNIKHLSQETASKISAGEIVQSPVNVVKELIENSLDARSTKISISLKNQGTFIKIKDNGCGFRKDDLNIACIKYTTSKLNSITDFAKLTSYGFRGEALSSICQVSKITIITKKKDEIVGSQATYENGQMISLKKQAANDGTTIIVEDLFHNISERKFNVMNTFNKEYNKIIEIVMSYAVHCSFCSFQLERDSNKPDVISQASDSKKSIIKELFGNKIFNNLIDLEEKDIQLEYTVEGYLSNTNSTLNQYRFILFLNNRLVDSFSLKKNIEDIYSMHLMKNCHPFVYINMVLPAANIDVNLGPSKREIRFLNEDLIIEKIRITFEQALKNASKSRSLNISTPSSLKKLNNSSNLDDSISSSKSDSSKTIKEIILVEEKSLKTKKVKLQANKIIRNQSNLRKIKEMLDIRIINERTEQNEIILGSIKELKTEQTLKSNVKLTYFTKNMTLIGCYGLRNVLVQYQNFIKIIDFPEFCKKFFYQQYLNNFGNFDKITLKPGLNIVKLLEIFKHQNPNVDENFNVKQNCLKLFEFSEMLDDYFSIKITNDLILESIPVLVNEHYPNYNLLPVLIWNLTGVYFEEEKKCFETMGLALADYYSMPLENEEDQKTMVSNMFPKLKELIKPSEELHLFIKNATDLVDLYKVFERC